MSLLLYLGCAIAESPTKRGYIDCVESGGKILKTYPAKCIADDGMIFLDDREKTERKKICKDLCGDGTCQEIVCMGSGCPCAENSVSCKRDCAANSN